ncbi:MAG: 16S rRNA (cytosine(1402)-N(4))-methyltransferase RsmH [Anaerolineae bacterium]|nr:16S rRNA (cytosine(1402)-N(4))-methyltransferase RsmH [Anaerolineae bacterium]
MGEPPDLGSAGQNQVDDSSVDAGAAQLPQHVPVLVHEVLQGLAARSGGAYLDATVGGGGHAVVILERSAPRGRLLGLDRDPEAADRAGRRLQGFGNRARVVCASYVELLAVAQREGFLPLDGILFDLGYSSWQIDNPDRGFAFSKDGPLDMRFNPAGDEPTAADLLNQLPEQELATLLRDYGEEPRSRHIARAIVNGRPFATTSELARAIVDAVGRRTGAIHPATRTFQALRIAVNRELEAVRGVLPDALEALKPGGRLAVIAFHSLEDRIVKRFLRQESRDCICPPELPICQCNHRRSLKVLTRKPLTPTVAEVERNPRSRSAKLRIAEKI